jgi:hypothetical protein
MAKAKAVQGSSKANPVIVAKALKGKGKAKGKEVAAKPEVVVKVSKGRLGVGKLVCEEILAGKLTNNEILDKVKKDIPAAKTTYACIAWYRTKLRKDGKIE